VQAQRNNSWAKSRSPSRRKKKEGGGSKDGSPNRTHSSYEKEELPRTLIPPEEGNYLGNSSHKKEGQDFPNFGSGSREGMRPPIKLAGEDPSLKKTKFGASMWELDKAMYEISSVLLGFPLTSKKQWWT
jgi:hypothetical protein